MNYVTPIGPHNGKSWETLCHACLCIRFGGEYREVPASPGDYGLDGFTVSGEAYQCYCPERECDDNSLYESQRTKVHDDIDKLKLYKLKISRVLGTTKLKRWYLLTPKITKNDLIAYCNEKTALVKSWKLPFIDKDFQIIPLDFKHIGAELPSALDALDYTINRTEINQRINLPTREIDNESIVQYKNDLENETYTSNAYKKHAILLRENVDDSTLIKRVDKTIKHVLKGDALLKDWEIALQDQLEKFNRIVELLEAEVEDICETSLDGNTEVYEKIKKLVKQKIDSEFKSLSEIMKMNLVNHVIADWLLRCPLNFSE